MVLFFRSQSTAMVMLGRSVYLTTLFFLGKLDLAVNQYFVHVLSLVPDNNPSRRREENGWRNDFMINLHESMGLNLQLRYAVGLATRPTLCGWKRVWILINWLDEKPADLYLCFHKRAFKFERVMSSAIIRLKWKHSNLTSFPTPWPWKLEQGHQNVIMFSPCHNVITMQIW